MPFVRETAIVGGKEIIVETGKWAKQAGGRANYERLATDALDASRSAASARCSVAFICAVV